MIFVFTSIYSYINIYIFFEISEWLVNLWCDD